MGKNTQTFCDGLGGKYYRNVNKCEGWYENIKTGEKLYLLDKCKGWRQLTTYGQNMN